MEKNHILVDEENVEIFDFIMKKCPKIREKLSQKRYVLPQFRVLDYLRNEDYDTSFFKAIALGAKGVAGRQVEIQATAAADATLSSILNNPVVAAAFDRPVLYLERELGEAFLRADLPIKNMLISELKWKWPQFQVCLPRGLITFQEDGVKHTITSIDMLSPSDPDSIEIVAGPYLEETLSLLDFLSDGKDIAWGLLGAGISLMIHYVEDSCFRMDECQHGTFVIGQTADQKIEELLDKVQIEGWRNASVVEAEWQACKLACSILIYLSSTPFYYQPQTVL